MATKSGEKVIFVKSDQYSLDTLAVENFDEIALSRTVKEIEANLCLLHFWQKIRKFKMAANFEESKFLKIANSTLLIYPVSRKF